MKKILLFLIILLMTPLGVLAQNAPTPANPSYSTASHFKYLWIHKGLLDANFSMGTTGYVFTSNGPSSAPTWQASGAGSTPPGGTNGQVQYNNSGVFGGLSNGTTGYVLTSNGSGSAPSFQAAGAGSGTVTSFSAGNLSPLFTTSVSTATTTPVLSFALTAGTNNSLLGYNGSGVLSGVTVGTGLSLTSGTLTATGGGGGVSSFTGDGVIFNNSASTGAVTATQATIGANQILGNPTTSAAAPVATYGGRMGWSSNASSTTLTASSNTFQSAITNSGITLTLPVASTCIGKEFVFFSGVGGGNFFTLGVQGSDVITFDSGTITSVNYYGNQTATFKATSSGNWHLFGTTASFTGTPAAGGLTYGSSSNNFNMSIGAAGTSGQLAVSGGTGAPTWTSTPSVTTLAATGNITGAHWINTGTAPTIAAGAGAGTSPTIAIAGHDGDFTITLTTGTTPTGSNAVIATVTFGTAYGSAPVPQLTATNANAAGLLSALTAVYPTTTTTTYILNSGTTALTAATQYIWACHTAQ